MSFRTTYILFGLLGALVIVFGLALWLAPYGKIDDKYVLPSIHDEKTRVKSDDIVKVEVERLDSDVHFVFARDSKDDKEFALEKPAGYRITSSLVFTLIGQVLGAKTEEGDLSSNLKDWGLDKPKGHITLTTDKGQELRVNLGDIQNNRVYVTSSEKPKTPMVLKKAALDAAYSHLYDFRARDLITYRSDDIKSVKIEKPAKDKTERIVLQSADGKWRYEEPKYGSADLEGSTEPDAKGPTGVRAVLTALTGIKAEGKADTDKDKKDEKKQPLSKEKELGFWEDDAKDLKQYGLDSEAAASLVLEAKKDPASKDSQKVLIGKETADKSDVFFARLASDRHVMTVTKKSLDTFRELLANPEALRDRDLVRLPEKPDVIRVKYPDGETIELVRSGAASAPPNPQFPGMGGSETWKMYRGKDKVPLSTDGEAVKKLIDALVSNKRQVKEFPTNPADPALGLGDPNNLTISLWVDGLKKEEKKEDKKDDKDKDEKKEEKKDKDKKEEKKEPKKDERPELKSDTPDVELSFGRVDSKKQVAIKRRSGKKLEQTDVVKVLDSVLEIARADSLAYLEKNLKEFFPPGEGPKAVVKLTTELDGKTAVAEKKKPDDAASEWVLKKPDEWAGRKADGGTISRILFGLNGLAIARWESLKPTAEQLGRWGLRSPSSKITLGLKIDKKDSEASLLVGNQTDDKAGFYAKKSDDDKVFVLKKEDLERLKGPLIDLQILDFQSGTVKSIKFAGWPQVGKPTAFELTREGAQGWKGKDLGAMAKVQSETVEKLLEAMASLRAKRFEILKTGPKPEQGLKPENGGLSLVLTLEEKDKKPETITLNVGNTTADGYFAESSKSPGDVFVIAKDQDIFEKVRKSSSEIAK